MIEDNFALVDQLEDKDDLAELETLLLAEEAERGLEDLYFFDKYILGYKDMKPKTHRPVCAFLNRAEGLRKKHIELPRGCFKSSVITVGYTVQSIAKNPDIRVLIDNEVYANSKAFLREIKSHMDDDDVLDLYPQLRPNKRINDGWTESSVIVEARERVMKEATISCAGLDQIKVGMHYDLIIMDDLVSNRNITTREQIEKVIEHYKLALSLLEPGGELILVGTRYHYSDLYGYLLENESDTFDHYIVPARLTEESAKYLNANFPDIVGKYGLYSGGDLVFPERLTDQFLIDQRRSQGTYIYNCQYMLNPVDSEEADFRREWIRYYKGRIEPKPNTDRAWQLTVTWVGDHKKNPLPDVIVPFTVDIKIAATVDPNNKKKKGSDDTAAIVVGYPASNDWFILDMTADILNPREIVDLIFNIETTYKPSLIGLEEVGKETLQFLIKERMRETNVFLHFTELKPGQVPKEDRIRRLVPRFERGVVYLPISLHKRVFGGKTEDIVEKFEDEYSYFPLAKHDDLMDAMAYQETLHAIISNQRNRSGGKRRQGKSKFITDRRKGE